jgi:single-stranded DNA-specific DHH superfamily exonuclease
MTAYDLFNGDADGICSLIQLRLTHPKDTTLVTGVKRDNALLDNIDAKQGDEITVLDLAMTRNTAALKRVLEQGAKVLYLDHHHAGDIPNHPNLEAHIKTASDTCTALIVDELIGKQASLWAIVGAYGDNLIDVADAYASQLNLTDAQKQELKTLGTALNYNGYGEQLSDLWFNPADLYRSAAKYSSPFTYIKEEAETIATLTNGYQHDLEQGLSVKPYKATEKAAMVILPDAAWARRISGVLGNELTNRYPNRMHLILSPKSQGGDAYQVSIRASKNNPIGADTLAKKFGGGGRERAAGIDRLLSAEIEPLWAEF